MLIKTEKHFNQMNRILSLIVLITLAGCASQKAAKATEERIGDTRTKEVEFINDNTYLLNERADDKTYGYNPSNPIKVGGSEESSGPKNQRRFLNALLGPNGEQIKYYRAGSCCPFKTPNGLINNLGMLDRYRISWTGSQDTLDIFINMYDKGDLKIPVGLTAKKQQ
ncbi:MAG: hypothetical protein LPJ89_02260 [Hymenobacteraceae bacterium]|nr:hypothetical protein [Hymenobacteraceae bacterium]MDX5396885.1 hypothetical protein [Hymenobacteraceae bacterium]MDX5442588.1 hypothetical protein [Hymenobacteraceae bacterium]